MFNKLRLWLLEQQVKTIVADDTRKKESTVTTAKKSVAKKAPVKKAPVKKATVKKTAPKKTTKKK